MNKTQKAKIDHANKKRMDGKEQTKGRPITITLSSLRETSVGFVLVARKCQQSDNNH